MGEIKIALRASGEAADPSSAERFRRDLDNEVGEANFSTRRVAGAKGMAMMDVATIAVSVMSSQAVLALIGVAKSYLERDRSSEIEFEGANGAKVRIRAADTRVLASREFGEFLENARLQK